MAPHLGSGSTNRFSRGMQRQVWLETWPSIARAKRSRRKSALLFLLDRLADDVGDVVIAFFFFLDEGGVVEALVDLDVFLFGCLGLGAGDRGLLLALLLRLGVLERHEFGFRRLWRHLDFLGHRRARGLGPRTTDRGGRNRDDLAGIGGDDGRLVQVVELTARVGADALGAKLGFSHRSGFLGMAGMVLHLAS